MAVAQDIHVKLSAEALEFVQASVSSGEFVSVNDVIAEGVNLLKSEAEERTRWERDVLLPAHDRLIANPASAVTDADLGASLEARRRMRTGPR
jgi:Arc/MetJ-type ribon-helix-helix transcriptional regulator